MKVAGKKRLDIEQFRLEHLKEELKRENKHRDFLLDLSLREMELSRKLAQ